MEDKKSAVIGHHSADTSKNNPPKKRNRRKLSVPKKICKSIPKADIAKVDITKINVAMPNLAIPNFAKADVAKPNVAKPYFAKPNVPKLNVAKPNVAMPNVSKTNVAKKKKNPFQAPRSISIPIATNEVFYKGSYFAKGDIVSVVNAGDSKVYYAQIRGLLKDQYEEKSAVLTWLLPSQESPKGQFDPNTFLVGPEDEIPRKLECLEFVCHSPSEYFMATKSSVPQIPEKPVLGYASTSKGPTIVTLPAEEFSTDSE